MAKKSVQVDKKKMGIQLLVTLVVQSLVAMSAVTIPVLIPTAAVEIGVSASYIGIYVGLIYISSMLSSMLSGNFIVRYGALRVSQMCLVFCGIGLSLAAAVSLPALMVSALVLGLGYGAATPASSHILVRSVPETMMSSLFSLKQTGVPLGGALAGAIVPSLVLLVGWKSAAVIVGAGCVILAIMIQPLRTEIDSDRQPGQTVPLKGAFQSIQIVLSHLPLRQLAIISFFYTSMQVCLTTYLVVYLMDNVGMALVRAGLILSTCQIAGAFGRILWGVIADRYFPARLVLGFLGVAMTAGAVAAATFGPGWSYPAILLVVTMFGATAIGWNGVYLAEAARLAPAGRVGAATGGTLVFTYLGVVVGPPVFAVVVMGTDSYAFGFVLFAVMTLVCGVVILIRGKNTEQSSRNLHGRFR